MTPEEVIRSRIDGNGLKVLFVAQRANMSKDLLSKSLNGKRKFKPLEFIKICSILGLDIRDFQDSA